MTLLSRASTLRHFRLIPVAALLFAVHTMEAQSPAAATKQAPSAATKPPAAAGVPDRASSYYHYGLARLYEDMAVNAGRSDYATQAVEQYKLALDADPNSRLLQDGLADLYFQDRPHSRGGYCRAGSGDEGSQRHRSAHFAGQGLPAVAGGYAERAVGTDAAAGYRRIREAGAVEAERCGDASPAGPAFTA